MHALQVLNNFNLLYEYKLHNENWSMYMTITPAQILCIMSTDNIHAMFQLRHVCDMYN